MIESVTLLNTSTLQSVTIDRDDSEFVLSKVDLGTVQGTHHSYKYVNQVGVYINSTTLEEREVSVEGWVTGDTYDLLEENKTVLNQLVNPLHYINLIVLDKYQLSFKPDYSIKYSTAWEENNEVICKFLIQGTCANPMFTTKEGQTALIATTIPKFHFPLIIPQNEGIIMGLREPSLLATLYNDGDIDTGLTIVFTCTSSVKNPSLLNVDTREYIKLNKTIAPGETVTISTGSGEKYIRGDLNGVETNYFAYLDLDSTWLQLHKGKNILKYDADSNPDGLEVALSFLPKYLEVQ